VDGDFHIRIGNLVEGAFHEGEKVEFKSAGTPEERVPRGADPALKVAIGSDHRGYELKRRLSEYLQELGHLVLDLGVGPGETADYPDLALKVSDQVARKVCDRGVLIDARGVASAMVANKIKGIRAAVGNDVESARSSRLHNDANVITFGASAVNRGQARRILRIWLGTGFEGGRHAKRLDKIARIEEDGLDARL
jgi:ribose 5-phosphate isomerase B